MGWALWLFCGGCCCSQHLPGSGLALTQNIHAPPLPSRCQRSRRQSLHSCWLINDLQVPFFVAVERLEQEKRHLLKERETFKRALMRRQVNGVQLGMTMRHALWTAGSRHPSTVRHSLAAAGT